MNVFSSNGSKLRTRLLRTICNDVISNISVAIPAVPPKKIETSVFGSKVQDEGMVGLRGECLMLS